MHIYVDEAGIFSNPQSKTSVPCCVGALALPTTKVEQIFAEFQGIKTGWGATTREVKGSHLNEIQVAEVVQFLIRHGALFEVSAIDMENHPPADIEVYREETVATMRDGIVPNPQPGPLEEALEIIGSVESMSQPLFVQAMIMRSLIPRVFRHSVIYYSRSLPSELAAFSWTIDAKEDQKVVEYERMWLALVFLTMYAVSLDAPIYWPAGGDYSHLDRFCHPVEDVDRELVRERGFNPDDLEALSLEMILGETHSFENSNHNLGLQLVDILVTSTRRALNGTLGEDGWGEIGRLILAERIDEHLWAIEPVGLRYWDGESDRRYTAQNAVHVYQKYLSKAKHLYRVRL